MSTTSGIGSGTATFTGVMTASTTLIVTGFAGTAIRVGQLVTGGTVSANTIITTFGTGTGGNGTYICSVSQTSTSTGCSWPYSLISSWLSAFTAGGWIGQCYNDSEFAVSGAEVATFSGHSTSPTNNIVLTTGPGQSFADNANAQTNELCYNQANGVGLRRTSGFGNVVSISEDYVTLSKLQINHATGNTAIEASGTLSTFDRNIFVALFGGGGATAQVSGSVTTNCLIIAPGNIGIRMFYSSGKSTVLVNLTVVAPSDSGNANVGVSVSSTTVAKNVAVFGFSGGSFSGSPTGSNNASDQPIGFGSANQASKTYASQFVNTLAATTDFRAKAGADLLDNGVTDTTDIPAAIDIVGTSRPQGSAWDIGCWELVVAGGSVGTIALNIAVAGVGAETAASVGTIGLNIAVAGVGKSAAASVGTVGLNIAVAGVGSEAAASAGTVGLNIAVAGVGAETAAGVGTVGLNIAVAGVGAGSSPGSGVGTISLNLDVAGVGASTAASVGTIGLNVAVAGVGAGGPVLLADYDTGRKKRADKRRDKEISEERKLREERRKQVIATFERVIEGKIEVSEAVADEIVQAIEAKAATTPGKEYIPSRDFDAALASVANIEALWREYLERDDEEVLVYL